MTKPKHLRYLEEFSDEIESLELDPGDVVGTLGEGKQSILLYLVSDPDGGHELLYFSPYYVEIALSRGKPYCVDSAFLVKERRPFFKPVFQPDRSGFFSVYDDDTSVPAYKIHKGTELHNYGSMIEGLNLPEGSIVPLTKARTLGRLVKRLEAHGLGRSKKK